MMASTYSEVTVASAAPLTPRPSGKISNASSQVLKVDDYDAPSRA